jgi:hypothetical protein
VEIRSAERSAIDAGRSENIVRIDELAAEDDHSFVEGLYSKVLRRPARPEEIAAGVSALQGVSRAAFATEIHCSAEAREKGNVIYDLLSPSEQIQFLPPTTPPLVPPIEHRRKVYHLFDLLAFEGAAYLIHLYRSVAKCQPDDAWLRRHLDALEQKRSTPLEILIEVVSSREARAAGTIVLGISDLVRRNEMRSAPLVLPIDPQKMEYTAGELLTVPQNLFITHLYRCLLKRDPDPEGEANYSARWLSGELGVDIIYDFSRSPETLKKGVRVTGLRATAFRRRLCAFPIVGRLFALAAHIIYLPELAMQFRASQHRPVLDSTCEPEREIDSLRAEVSALMERLGQTPPANVQNESDDDVILSTLLKGKVDADQLTEAIEDKVTRQEFALALESRASLEQLAGLEERKADSAEIHSAVIEQTRRIEAVEKCQVESQQIHDILLEQVKRIDTIEQRQQQKVESSAFQELAVSTTAMQRSLDDVLAKLTGQQKEALSCIHSHKLRILDIERRLALVLEEARKRLPAPIDEPQIRAIAEQLEALNASQ